MSSIAALRGPSASAPQSKRELLPVLPKDLFELITTFLKQSETTFSLLRACKQMQELTLFARLRVKHLNISARLKPTALLPDHLHSALRQHPNFISVDLGRRTQISNDVLIETFKTRPIVGFYARGASLATKQSKHFNSAISPWVQVLNALKPETLEHLDLTLVSQGHSSLSSFLPEFASRCPNLKTLKIPNSQPLSSQSCLRLISLLPRNLEYLGPNWASVDCAIAAALISRFNAEKIKGCNLAFETEPDEKTIEMQFALLRFLPLLHMNEITLRVGPKNEEMFGRTLHEIQCHLPPVFPAAMIDYIASQTEKNSALEKLVIVGLSESEELLPSLLRLINSLNSNRLREFTLRSKDGVIPDLTFIAQALMKKLPHWKNIDKITVNGLTLCNLLEPENSSNSSSFAFNLLSRAAAVFTADEVLQEKARKTVDGFEADEQKIKCTEEEHGQIEAQITALSRIPISKILAYYAQVHNTLNPNSPLQPNQIFACLQAFKQKNPNLAWTSTLELIKLLEKFLGEKKAN